MPSISDLSRLGPLPLQDHQAEWPDQYRPGVLWGMRVIGRNDKGDYIVETDGKGDILPWNLWKRDTRPTSAFAMGWAATQVEAAGTPTGPAQGAGCGNLDSSPPFLPIGCVRYFPDEMFERKEIGRPYDAASNYFKWAKPPKGMFGMVMSTTETKTQTDLFLPTDPNIYAVWHRGDPDIGSRVYDVGPDHYPVHQDRWERMQSLVRVIKRPGPFTKFEQYEDIDGNLQTRHRNALGFNINKTYCDRTYGGIAVDLPIPSTNAKDPRILGVITQHSGGPFEPTQEGDQHIMDRDDDAQPMLPQHLSTNSFFTKNEKVNAVSGLDYDAPLDFEDYGISDGVMNRPQVLPQSYDYLTRAHIWLDFEFPHYYLWDDQPYKANTMWRLYTEVPFSKTPSCDEIQERKGGGTIKGGGRPGEITGGAGGGQVGGGEGVPPEPGQDTPTRRSDEGGRPPYEQERPGVPTGQPGPGRIGDEPSIPEGGSGEGGTGGGTSTEELQRELEEYHRRLMGMGDDRNMESAGIPDNNSIGSYTSFPGHMGTSSQFARPQRISTEDVDFRSLGLPTEDEVLAHNSITPVVGRSQSYGSQGEKNTVNEDAEYTDVNGETPVWELTTPFTISTNGYHVFEYTELPCAATFAGGTAPGGTAHLPPELDIRDFQPDMIDLTISGGGDTRNAVWDIRNDKTLSNSYQTHGPNVWTAWGLPDVTSGGMLYGWRVGVGDIRSDSQTDTVTEGGGASTVTKGPSLEWWIHNSFGNTQKAIEFFGSTGRFGWYDQTAFWGQFAHANTKNCIYSFPNITGQTVLLGSGGTSGIPGGRVPFGHLGGGGYLDTHSDFAIDGSRTLTIGGDYKFKSGTGNLVTLAHNYSGSRTVNIPDVGSSSNFTLNNETNGKIAANQIPYGETGGAGYLSAHTGFTYTSGTKLFSTDGDILFQSGTAFNGTVQHAITANRAWDFPNIDGRVLTTADADGLFTAKNMVHADANGQLAEDTTCGPFVDSTNHWVGIGQSTPLSRLHVADDSTVPLTLERSFAGAPFFTHYTNAIAGAIGSGATQYFQAKNDSENLSEIGRILFDIRDITTTAHYSRFQVWVTNNNVGRSAYEIDEKLARHMWSLGGTPLAYLNSTGLGVGVTPTYKLESQYEIGGGERSSDPPQPAEGKWVMWMSDGTGKGDDGDVLIASTAAGTTKYTTLFDHSSGSAW